MGLLDRYAAASGAAVNDVVDRLFCALGKLGERAGIIEVGTTGTARTLAFQYGAPPTVGSSNLAPRSMTDLPWIAEGVTTEQQTRLDVFAEQSRYGFAGFLANIGDDEFKAAWIGINGSTSGLFTVPPAATVQVPCIVRGVLVELVGGLPARYQVSLS